MDAHILILTNNTLVMWANMLNCKLEQLPITYLGIPMDSKALRMAASDPLVHKMRKRLDPWKGKFNFPLEGT